MAKRIYTTKINGVSHACYMNLDGSTYFDPPIPEEREKMNKARMADMVESRRAPGSKTDSDYLKGFGTLNDQFRGDQGMVKKYVRLAKEQGYTPSHRDVYVPLLADRPGDPKAWITGRGDLKRRAIEKGVPLEGNVNVSIDETEAARARKREVEKAKSVRLAPDLVRKYEQEAISRNPDLKHASKEKRAEVRHEIIKKHGGKE